MIENLDDEPIQQHRNRSSSLGSRMRFISHDMERVLGRACGLGIQSSFLHLQQADEYLFHPDAQLFV